MIIDSCTVERIYGMPAVGSDAIQITNITTQDPLENGTLETPGMNDADVIANFRTRSS